MVAARPPHAQPANASDHGADSRLSPGLASTVSQDSWGTHEVAALQRAEGWKREEEDSWPVRSVGPALSIGPGPFTPPEDFPGQTQPRTSISVWEKTAYRFDYFLSKRWIQCCMLAFVGAVGAILLGLGYALVLQHGAQGDTDAIMDECDPRDGPSVNWYAEGIWEAWTFMADPGTHAKAFWSEQRIFASMITIFGILFFSTIVAVIVDITREKMDLLRQGKSQVVEVGHTLILGWTDKTILVISELCVAMESEGGGVIVVLAMEDKFHMEMELGLQLSLAQRRGTKVIFRLGSPLLISDLTKVSADTAKAIVVLAGSGDPDKADAETLRSMLSLRSMHFPMQGFVVAEVRDIDNEPLVKLVGGEDVETLVSHDVLGRLMLMSARQPGLAKVYEALLGFEGDEFYMHEWDELDGLKFGDLVERFPDAVPIGLHTEDGRVILKPAATHVMAKGDKLIVIAEDDDTYEPCRPLEVEVGYPPTEEDERKKKERVLFCGWRRDIRDILQYLDHLVIRGSEVHMMSHCVPIEEREKRLMEEGLDVRSLRNLKLVHWCGNTSVRRKLEQLPIQTYNSCMIFADQAFESDAMHADSHSLATLLLFRDIQAYRKATRKGDSIQMDDPTLPSLARSLTTLRSEQMQACPIVCEVLDPRTQKTIQGNKHVTLASDFCQTNKLIAQVVAMVAEERSVKLLLDELLGVKGCNINVVSAAKYVSPGEKVNFYQLAKRAMQFDELAIGYQLQHSIDKTKLNPHDKSKVMNWDHYDIPILQGQGKVYRLSTDQEEDVKRTLGAFGAMEARNDIRTCAKEEAGAAPGPDAWTFSSGKGGKGSKGSFSVQRSPDEGSARANSDGSEHSLWSVGSLEQVLKAQAPADDAVIRTELAARQAQVAAADARAALSELHGMVSDVQQAVYELSNTLNWRPNHTGGYGAKAVAQSPNWSALLLPHNGSCAGAADVLDGFRSTCSAMSEDERKHFGAVLDRLKRIVSESSYTPTLPRNASPQQPTATVAPAAAGRPLWDQ